MENATTRGGNGDRRKTVSGALPPKLRHHRHDDDISPTEAMRFPWSWASVPTSPTSPTSPAASSSPASSKSSSHKRTFSGTLFSKLNFLRPLGEHGRPPSRDKEPHSPTKSFFSRKSIDDDTPVSSPTSPKDDGSMSSALKQSKTRKRKGSLRKTALLGGKRFIPEGRERRGSLLQRSPSSKHPVSQLPQQEETLVSPPPAPVLESKLEPPAVAGASDEAPSRLRRQFSYEHGTAASSSDSGWSDSAAVTATRLSLVTEHKAQLQTSSATDTSSTELASPVDIKSPTSQTSYASTTTDEEDILTFDARPTAPTVMAPPPKPLSSAATSYFPSNSSEMSLPLRPRTSKRSPLSHTISSSSLDPSLTPHHSYAETEYWGWIILFSTWLIFTVGMGSTLEIWSWAWDVGETPYAPPELEDDPTLPIVGYYPALIVLTGVVAWVWITVAWVGMKYFRHAKIEV